MSPNTFTDISAEPWLNFRNPLVRQLAFSVASPNILQQLPPALEQRYGFDFHPTDCWLQHFDHYQSRLKHLDQHPAALEDFLSQLKSTRLGLRFEMLLWFWLTERDYHPYELLGHSIQIIDGPRTTGELDFLLLNHNHQQVEHWEVALKYYLAERDLSLPYWYGLNRSDTLLRKLTHFTQKQFQFQQAQGHTIQQRFAVLKGQLYLPEHVTAQALPDWVNPERRIGTWGQHLPHNLQDFYRLQRHEWICPHAYPSSSANAFWSNGLYLNQDQSAFYMYRNPVLMDACYQHYWTKSLSLNNI